MNVQRELVTSTERNFCLLCDLTQLLVSPQDADPLPKAAALLCHYVSTELGMNTPLSCSREVNYSDFNRRINLTVIPRDASESFTLDL